MIQYNSDTMDFWFYSVAWLLNWGVLIIPGLSEPPVRTLGATIPKIESHVYR